MSTDRTRQRIQQLLAIAGDDAASPAERELAMQRATMLMARHSITTLTDDPQARARDLQTCTITVPGGTSTASLAVAYGICEIARAADAGAYCTDRRRQRRTTDHGPGVDVHLVATTTDLDWLAPLALTVIAYAALGWATWRQDNPRRWRPMKPATRRRVRNGYQRAWAAGVADRVRTTRRTTLNQLEAAGDTSTALTVRTLRQRVTDHIDALGLATGRHLDTDLRAAAQGRADGWASGLGTPTHTHIERN